MSRKGTNIALVVLLSVTLLVAFTGCEKLKVSKLRSNYHFTNANRYFTDGDYRRAIEEYEAALRDNPSLTEAYRFLGESYKNRFRPGVDNPDNNEKAEKALEALNKALELEPKNKDIIYSLGDMYDRLKRFEDAEKMYLMIIELEPGNMNNYYVVAEFYKRYAGENEELKAKAERMYLRRIETDPENPQGYAYMADYYDHILPIPEFDKAYEISLKRLEIESNDALVYYSLGVNRFNKAYRLQNLLSLDERKVLERESEQALLKSIDVDPNFPDAYAYMKLLYINVSSRVYPERERRYLDEAEQWGEKYNDARKRQLERMKLEKELKKTD